MRQRAELEPPKVNVRRTDGRTASCAVPNPDFNGLAG